MRRGRQFYNFSFNQRSLSLSTSTQNVPEIRMQHLKPEAYRPRLSVSPSLPLSVHVAKNSSLTAWFRFRIRLDRFADRYTDNRRSYEQERLNSAVRSPTPRYESRLARGRWRCDGRGARTPSTPPKLSASHKPDAVFSPSPTTDINPPHIPPSISSSRAMILQLTGSPRIKMMYRHLMNSSGEFLRDRRAIDFSSDRGIDIPSFSPQCETMSVSSVSSLEGESA